MSSCERAARWRGSAGFWKSDFFSSDHGDHGACLPSEVISSAAACRWWRPETSVVGVGELDPVIRARDMVESDSGSRFESGGGREIEGISGQFASMYKRRGGWEK